MGTRTGQKEYEGCWVAARQRVCVTSDQQDRNPQGWEVSAGNKVELQGMDATLG